MGGGSAMVHLSSCWYSIFSPVNDTWKLLTPPITTSVFRLLRSKRWTVKTGGACGEGSRHFDGINDSRFAGLKTHVPDGWHRKRQNALADVLQIDLNLHLLGALVLVLVVFLGPVFLGVVLLGLVLLLFVVAFRCQRRRFTLGEHNQIHTRCDRPRKALDIRLHSHTRIGAGGKVQVL